MQDIHFFLTISTPFVNVALEGQHIGMSNYFSLGSLASSSVESTQGFGFDDRVGIDRSRGKHSGVRAPEGVRFQSQSIPGGPEKKTLSTLNQYFWKSA